MLDGVLDVFGMGEEHAAPAHRDIGRRGGAILPRAWINGVKQNLMRVENVGVGERLFLGEPRESIVDTGRKGRMLKPPDDRGVLFLLGVPQVAACREVAERIEGHGLASRRYCV